MFNKIFAVLALAAASASALAAPCAVKDQRVCRVYDAIHAAGVAHEVVFQDGSGSANSPAAEFEWRIGAADLVHIGNSYRYEDDDELFFVVAHEIGHSVLRHGRDTLEHFSAAEDRSLPDLELFKKYGQAAIAGAEFEREMNHRHEFQADQFAIKVMLAAGKDPIAAMSRLLKLKFSDSTHPSRRMRIEQAKAYIASMDVKVASAN